MVNNISCGVDIAKATSECFKIPLFCKIVNTKEMVIQARYVDNNGDMMQRAINLENTNRLLWTGIGCLGGKTGCNSRGGESLVACYEGRVLVVILGALGREQKFMDCEKLIGWLREKLDAERVAKNN